MCCCGVAVVVAWLSGEVLKGTFVMQLETTLCSHQHILAVTGSGIPADPVIVHFCDTHAGNLFGVWTGRCNLPPSYSRPSDLAASCISYQFASAMRVSAQASSQLVLMLGGYVHHAWRPSSTFVFFFAVKGLEDVQACLEVVQATVCLSGWPSIPEAVLQVSTVLKVQLALPEYFISICMYICVATAKLLLTAEQVL